MAGYGGARFIATQGPVPESFVAFWQMMWEQKCRVIAMVTNEVGLRRPTTFTRPSGQASTTFHERIVVGEPKRKVE